MSFAARDWAKRQTTGSGTAKAVLRAYAEFADHGDGTLAYPTIAALEALTEFDRKAIMTATAHLVGLGLLADTGARRGLRKSIKVYAVGPQRVPEMGLLGQHAAPEPAATSPESGTARPAAPAADRLTSPALSPDESRIRDRDFPSESKKEAQAGAGARDPVDNRATAAGKAGRMLGEGFAGLPASPRGAVPAPVLVTAAFEEWDAMERAHGLPGPVRRTVAREAAMVAKLRAHGSAAVAVAIAAAGIDHARPRRPSQRRPDQSDWLTMFDQVFEADREYRGLKLFERLLALPAALLDAAIPDAGEPVAETVDSRYVPACETG